MWSLAIVNSALYLARTLYYKAINISTSGFLQLIFLKKLSGKSSSALKSMVDFN